MYDVPRANAVDAVSDHPSSIGPYHCGYEGSEDSWIDGRSVVLFDVSVVAEDVKDLKGISGQKYRNYKVGIIQFRPIPRGNLPAKA